MIKSIVCLGLFVAITVQAQHTEVPKAPYVVEPKPPARWTVEIEGNAKGASAPKLVEISRQTTSARMLITWMDGRRSQEWLVGGRRYFTVPERDFVYAIAGSRTADEEMEISYFDLSLLAWLDPKFFKNSEDKEGRITWLFEDAENGRSALIDAGNRFPIQFSLQGRTFRYSSVERKPEALSIPSEFQATIARDQEILKRRAMPR